MATLNTTNIKHASSSSNNIVLASDGKVTFPQNTGNILQVVSVTKTDTTSLASSSWHKISGLQPSITPSSTSNKILIQASFCIGASSKSADTPLKLFRSVGGSDTDIGIGDADGDRTRCFWGTEDWFGNNNSSDGSIYITASVSTNFLDSPNTTSAITYGVNWRITSGHAVYLNRTGQDNNGSNYPRGSSTITLMEVAA